MRLFQEAGLPDGVINLVYGAGAEIGDAALASPDLAGVHFTGSTAVFQGMWKTIGANIERYRNYPRIVGETGGKDFIVAHETADVAGLATAIIRGSFEYQGQKCSAASRVFVPDNLWPELRERLASEIDSLPVGDVRDFSNFMGAVIDANSFKTQKTAIDEAKEKATIVAGGSYDDAEGWFVRPTVVETKDPDFRLLKEELFGPVVTAFVYPHDKYDDALELIDKGSPYGLTGAVFARDRGAIDRAEDKLRCEPAVDQGDVRAADGLPVSVHERPGYRRHLASRRCERPLRTPPSWRDSARRPRSSRGPLRDTRGARRGRSRSCARSRTERYEPIVRTL